MRKEARTEAEKAHFTAAAQEHKQGVFSDRAVGRRLMFISENSTRQGEGYSPEHGVLYLSLDGMDQVSWVQNIFHQTMFLFLCMDNPSNSTHRLKESTIKLFRDTHVHACILYTHVYTCMHTLPTFLQKHKGSAC